MKHLLRFYRYIFDWENYLLLARAIEAARLVRKHTPERAVSPHFGSALAAVDQLYLPPQTGWKISDEQKIARFAAFVMERWMGWVAALALAAAAVSSLEPSWAPRALNLTIFVIMTLTVLFWRRG